MIVRVLSVCVCILDEPNGILRIVVFCAVIVMERKHAGTLSFFAGSGRPGIVLRHKRRAMHIGEEKRVPT